MPQVIALCEEQFEETCFDKSVDLRRRLINSNDEFKFDFVFVTLSSGWSASYYFNYFTANGPQKLIDGFIPTIFPHQEQKEEQENAKDWIREKQVAFKNFLESLQMHFKDTNFAPSLLFPK